VLSALAGSNQAARFAQELANRSNFDEAKPLLALKYQQSQADSLIECREHPDQ
jgi:hypothetical protein